MNVDVLWNIPVGELFETIQTDGLYSAGFYVREGEYSFRKIEQFFDGRWSETNERLDIITLRNVIRSAEDVVLHGKYNEGEV